MLSIVGIEIEEDILNSILIIEAFLHFISGMT